MTFLKLVVGGVVAFIAMAIVGSLLGFLLGVVGILMKLIWLAVLVGIATLVVWVVYKLFFPGDAEQY